MIVCVQLCLTVCDLMDYSLQGCSVHGIFQANALDCIAISYFRDIPTQGSNLHLLPLLHWQGDSLPLCHLGSHNESTIC